MPQGAMDGDVAMYRMYGISQRARDGSANISKDDNVTIYNMTVSQRTREEGND